MVSFLNSSGLFEQSLRISGLVLDFSGAHLDFLRSFGLVLDFSGTHLDYSEASRGNSVAFHRITFTIEWVIRSELTL